MLQHPAERQRTLATVPLLQLCLAGVSVSRGRTFPLGRCAQLDAVLDAALRGEKPCFVLWTGSEAQDFAEAVADVRRGGEHGAYSLVLLDGTWTSCAEMGRLLLARLPTHSPFVRLVRFPAGLGNDASLLLFTEPAPGCMCTAEAVARALCILEPEGEAIRDTVLRPLRRLVELQRQRDVVGKGVKGAPNDSPSSLCCP